MWMVHCNISVPVCFSEIAYNKSSKSTPSSSELLWQWQDPICYGEKPI